MVTPWHSEKVPGLRESELGSHPLPPSRDEVWLTSNRLVLTSGTSCYHEHCYCTVAQSPSHVWLFVTTWTAAGCCLHCLPEFAQTHVHWASSVIQPSHALLPLLLLPSIFPSIRVFSNESVLCIRWPKYWSFSFSISPSNEHSGLISFRMDCSDLLTVQGTLKSPLQLLSNTTA